MDLILLGAPGAGKGTQGAMLAARLGVPKIATGDILRDAVRRGTPLGQEAERYMNAGELVPDTVILELVAQVLAGEDARRGAILDGFPRTVGQAEQVNATLSELGRKLTAVVVMEVPDDTIVRRMSGRRSCPNCGSVYNVHFKPPAVDGVCDLCGGALVQRPDDEEAKVRRRLDVYRATTEPLIRFYQDTDVAVHRISGDRAIEVVQHEIEARLGI